MLEQTTAPVEPPVLREQNAAPLAPRRRSSGITVSTIRYLLRTEVHTFAFSVAANAILSFFPFVVLLMTLIRRVFHSRVMYDVILELLRDYLPAGQEFVIRNLNAMVNSRQRVQIVSLIILLVTSSGVFMPLEVALNRIWRFPNNRSYLGNQLISLGLAFGCGVLTLLSIALTAEDMSVLQFVLRGHGTDFIRLAAL
jgi:membrane protein